MRVEVHFQEFDLSFSCRAEERGYLVFFFSSLANPSPDSELGRELLLAAGRTPSIVFSWCEEKSKSVFMKKNLL